MKATSQLEVKSIELDDKLKPFIRWAGGKQKLINEIYQHVNLKEVNRFFEPFLGGASFFLYGRFTHSFISDLNPNLINCYQQIKNNPIEVHNGLSRYVQPVSDEVYYRERTIFNNHNGEETIDQAVRFIFLNRTSYNGIYRVNKLGMYNVPFGKPNPAFPSLEHLIKISEKLQDATVFCGFYDEIERLVQPNDLIYLDPPYPKLSDTAYFNHYTLDKFDNEEQEKVSKFAKRISDIGSKVIISNADLPQIRELYSEWQHIECSTYRYVSCKKKRVKVKELIIKNY